MLDTRDILETIQMIREENLDIRTITMGISLFDCVSDDADRLCEKVYDKITKKAENLVKTGEKIEHKYGGKVCYGNGHAALIADFYDCISTGRPFSINATEAAKATRLILAAYRSNGVKIDI